MNLQDNTTQSSDETIQVNDFLKSTPFHDDKLENITNLTEFEKELGHTDELDFDNSFEFDDDFESVQLPSEIKQFNMPPLFNLRAERPIFTNFLAFESHYIDHNGLRENVDLKDKYIELTEQSEYFEISLHFSDNETVYEQIKYYKTILNNISRLKDDLNKIMKVLKVNNIKEVPKVIIASSYNDIFPSWSDKKSHRTPACYQYDTIYIFANYKLKRCLKLKDTRHSLIHELGHMIEDRLYESYFKCKNKYSHLIREDFKLALQTKTSRFLNYKRYAGFYDHVAPPTTFSNLNNGHILNSSPAHELFAETLTYYMEFNGRNVKRRYREVNSPILNEMFPNTNYIVKQTVLGKSVNKYKVLKQKKMTKMIKL